MLRIAPRILQQIVILWSCWTLLAGVLTIVPNLLN
jgi:hypothetical protein